MSHVTYEISYVNLEIRWDIFCTDLEFTSEMDTFPLSPISYRISHARVARDSAVRARRSVESGD